MTLINSICSSFWSGKIPKEFYITQEDSYNNTTTYQTVIVKKGSKLKLNFEIEDSGVFLKWDFKTHNHDIKFGVRALNMKTGEKFNEVDLKRIEASETEEHGFITCQANHKCNLFLSQRETVLTSYWFLSDTVTFDNSYSYFKSKKLTYSVVTTTPLTEIEKSASKIEEKIFDHNENDISEVQRSEWTATTLNMTVQLAVILNVLKSLYPQNQEKIYFETVFETKGFRFIFVMLINKALQFSMMFEPLYHL